MSLLGIVHPSMTYMIDTPQAQAHSAGSDQGRDAMTDAVLFDIDGVLADGAHRSGMLDQQHPDWNAFYLACGSDAPIREGIWTAQAFATQASRSSW